MHPTIKQLLLEGYFTLYYFQQLVDRVGLYYDRSTFRRITLNLNRYSLFQYRQLYLPEGSDAVEPTSSEQQPPAAGRFTIKLNAHLTFLKYFFLFWTLRSLAIISLPAVTRTRLRRILIGTEFLRKDSFYIETTVFFWSAISWLFFQFTLSTSLLDYKFLAIYRVSSAKMASIQPKQLGLNEEHFRKFRRFRYGALLYYHSLMGSLIPMSFTSISYLHTRGALFTDFPLHSTIWLAIILYWVYMVCAVIYSNLVAFIVVAKYVSIKQLSISPTIRRCLARLSATKGKVYTAGDLVWRSFMETNWRYSHFLSELADYSHFWSSYLTAVFVFYVLLVSFIAYMCLFGQAATYINACYVLIFNFHVVLLSTIIFYCGQIVLQNIKLSAAVSALVARISRAQVRLTVLQLLKLHSLNEYFTQLHRSGFSLLNGYVITHNTYHLLLTNIIAYFLLIIKKVA